MPRPQFSLKTMPWLMAVVAAFFAGIDVGHKWAWRDAVRQVYVEDVETVRRLMNESRSVMQASRVLAHVPPISVAVFVALSLAMLGVGVVAIKRRNRAASQAPRSGAQK